MVRPTFGVVGRDPTLSNQDSKEKTAYLFSERATLFDSCLCPPNWTKSRTFTLRFALDL